MRLDSAHFKGFKRFTDLRIQGIPESSRLIMLAGPNGSGKSSIFDGLKTWHSYIAGVGFGWDESYGTKVGTPSVSWPEHVNIDVHGGLPPDPEDRKAVVYLRSAFRNEADFQVNQFSHLPSPLDSPRISRMIDNDVSVSENYQRLIMQTIEGVYDATLPDNMTKGEIRDRIIGAVRDAMRIVFPDLVLSGIGGMGTNTTMGGTFYFHKGTSTGFLYKNLSAGEKAAFDLILDTVIKREFYSNSIWCIDEPETHLNTRIQGVLLQTLLDLLPEPCQLIVASHSIGFMRKGWELAKARPGQVTFLDLQGANFDEPTVLNPVQPNREFWARTLDVALGDLALLVAPDHVVLCEGRPAHSTNDKKAAFDAQCYTRIFSTEYPNTDFISVGNSHDAGQDRLELGSAIKTLASGTQVTRLIDRDLRSPPEVEMLMADGVRVLSRRHIESYLLDDEVLAALCERQGQSDRLEEVLAIKTEEIAASVGRGNDLDDVKSPAGSIYNRLRRLLGLTNAGSDFRAFARETLSDLLKPPMSTYQELKASIFVT